MELKKMTTKAPSQPTTSQIFQIFIFYLILHVVEGFSYYCAGSNPALKEYQVFALCQVRLDSLFTDSIP